MTKKTSPGCFSASIDLSLKDKLECDLIEKGFVLAPLPYAFFSAKKEGLCCTLYLSGKITVQGNGKDSFLEFYLEPEILQNLSYTHPASLHDPAARIGLDEAGKGDFFGPLCIAGFYAPEGSIEKLLQLGVKDSKKLSDFEVLKLSHQLKNSFPHKVLSLFPKTYNRLYQKFQNLNHLLGWGHATVLEELSATTGCKKALLDQFAFPGLMESILKKKNLMVDLVQKTKGEEDPVVAAASILARAAFLEGLKQLENAFHIPLPKGASSLVTQAAQKAVLKQGPAILEDIAKMHFKTTQAVLNAQNPSH